MSLKSFEEEGFDSDHDALLLYLAYQMFTDILSGRITVEDSMIRCWKTTVDMRYPKMKNHIDDGSGH